MSRLASTCFISIPSPSARALQAQVCHEFDNWSIDPRHDENQGSRKAYCRDPGCTFCSSLDAKLNHEPVNGIFRCLAMGLGRVFCEHHFPFTFTTVAGTQCFSAGHGRVLLLDPTIKSGELTRLKTDNDLHPFPVGKPRGSFDFRPGSN